jgi:hypothetical protein
MDRQGPARTPATSNDVRANRKHHVARRLADRLNFARMREPKRFEHREPTKKIAKARLKSA